jgi:hypothetical protein
VPFFHLTTRVEGDKYQKLLQEKGGTGFPYLVFMDAEGNVLTRQGDRSVDGFKKTLDTLKSWQAAKKKAEGGDKAALKEVFLAELALGKLKAGDALVQLTKLEGLSKEEIAKAEETIHGLEVSEITANLRTPEDRAAAAVTLLGMHKAGSIPSGQPALRAYTVMLTWAMEKKRWKFCDELLPAFKAKTKDLPNIERMVKSMEDRIAKAKAADPTEGGEEAEEKKEEKKK